MAPSKSDRVTKRKKSPAKTSVVKSSRPLKFLDSVLHHQPQLAQIIRAKPCAVVQHPLTAAEERATPQIPWISFVYPDYHTTACALQCLAQAVKDIEAVREHVDHLSRTIIPSKPGQFFELMDKSRQRLDRIYNELDDIFNPIFALLEEHFDLDQLIENDPNPKLIKRGGKPIEINPLGVIKKENHEENDSSLTTTAGENQPGCSFKFEDAFPDSQFFHVS